MNDLTCAKEILKDGCTCVLCRNGEVLTSTLRGVKPLLDFYDSKKDFSGFSAADKVVGKGAAFLYVLLNIKTVYADVISKKAAKVFEQNGIEYEYETIVPAIKNRSGDGFCPIETALADITDSFVALNKIRETLKQLEN